METNIDSQQIIDKCQALLEKINSKIQKNTETKASNEILKHTNIIDNSDIQEDKRDFSSFNEDLKNSLKARIEKNLQMKDTSIVFEKSEKEDNVKLEDIAVIQSFYGTNIERIKAVTTALMYMLKSSVLPKDWIFVEAQTSKSNCAFAWLHNYGVKYFFKKATKQQMNIFLKTPLWNIGTLHTNAAKLVFIDADVMYCKDNWLKSVDEKLDEFDVISPFGYSYSENFSSETLKLNMSICKKIHDDPTSMKAGHTGLGIAMTRNSFNMINGFDPTIILDDIWNYGRILGKEKISSKEKWLPCEFNRKEKDGYPFNVGSTDEICCHVYHGDLSTRKFKALTSIWKNHIKSLDELFSYNKKDFETLPIWNEDSQISQIVLNSVERLKEDDSDGLTIFFKEAEKIYGKIDESNPLVICIDFVPTYKTRVKDLLELKAKLEENCLDLFTFVVFTNEDISEYGIDSIPLSKKYNRENPILELSRKDVKFPKNASVVLLDFNTRIDKEFSVLRFNSIKRFDELSNYIMYKS